LLCDICRKKQSGGLFFSPRPPAAASPTRRAKKRAGQKTCFSFWLFPAGLAPATYVCTSAFGGL